LDAGAWQQEARGLQKDFVPYLEETFTGWKALCLHGLGNGNVLASDTYGYPDEVAAPHGWTEAAARAPRIKAFLQSLLDGRYFADFHRVRIMRLEPGAAVTKNVRTENFLWAQFIFR
jgi:hypothetical protein